ncbi:MAG: pyridoxal-phosphate dependent enzyme [Vicinamibacterales bacterium]
MTPSAPAAAPSARPTRTLPPVLSLIGGTPLVRLPHFEPKPTVELWAKLEGRNPGGSVKDRAAARMLVDGLASGALRPGLTLLDATSGNTGIAYAMLGAAMDVPVALCIPANVSEERKRILRAFDATLVFTDPMEGSDGAIREARRRAASAPDRYFYPDQYNNPSNWQAHYDTTGAEILEQTGGRITHFVAGLGTSGTFTGTARRLKRALPLVRTISAQPASPLHAIEGWKHMATAIVPGIYDASLADEALTVATEDAWEHTRALARGQGLFVGVSSGAALAAACAVARTLERGVVVTVFPDGGERYLSDPMWLEGGVSRG